MIQEGMLMFDIGKDNGHLVSLIPYYIWMSENGIIADVCNHYITHPAKVLDLHIDQLAFKIEELREENKIFKGASKIAVSIVNDKDNLDRQFDFIALIEKSKFRLSEITLQLTIPKDGMKLKEAKVDYFNIKYAEHTDTKKPFNLYDRIDFDCIHTLLLLAYYKDKPDKVKKIISGIPNLKDTFINNMLKAIFPNLITSSKSLIDKKNGIVNINLDITNPSYLIK